MERKTKLIKETPLLFLHVPKTGGTTMTNLLLSNYTSDKVCPARHWLTPKNWEIQKHRNPLSEFTEDLSNYLFFTGHFLYEIINLIPSNPIVITILRDPVDRIISLYNYIKILEDHPLRKEVEKMSLEDFAEWDIPDRPFENKNRYVYDFGVQMDIRKPSDISKTIPKENNLYKTALDRIENIDFVGITEKFNESVLLLSYILGIEPNLSFRNYKVNPNKTNNNNISPKVRRIISENNSEDMMFYQQAKSRFEKDWRLFIDKIFLS